MHDSRRAADQLLHQFKVTLCNVFDTMVADAKIQCEENYGHWPSYMRRLSAVLTEHAANLRLTKSAINLTLVRSRDTSLDEKIFAERPLTREIEEVLVRDVMYLLNLCSHLKNTILKSILQASNACLGELRDTTDEVSWRAKIEKQERGPESFQCFTRHTNRCVGNFRDAGRRRRIDLDVDSNGFHVGVRSGNLSLPFMPSHNSIPHGGTLNEREDEAVPDHLRIVKC